MYCVTFPSPSVLHWMMHFTTFSDRFADTPVKIAELSRFRNAKETTAALKGIADGSIDIVIGTHRIVQADSAFKDLGLVIVDEEQKFGVKQKEKIRQIESKTERTIHFSFNTTIAKKETPFSRRYRQMLELTPEELQAKIEQEKEAFQGYLERFESETLEEGEVNPIVFGETPYKSFSLSKI